MSGSAVVDDDRTVSDNQLKALSSACDYIIIQEKVDGANVSVHFEQEWVPVMQKRGGLILNREKDQYNVFRDYCYNKMEELYAVTGTQYVVYGEWLWCQHHVAYQALPDYFIVFDIMEKESGMFLAYDRVVEMVGDLFHVVPLLAKLAVSEIKGSFQEQIVSLLNRQSHFGEEDQEGVYVRFEGGDYVRHRVKLRRETFTSGRDDFNTNVITNSLKED
eukprot:TRINITY_DN4706_c0_g1_i1.p1 TRINITY_DN4706_c0_g1~~TRINITY_DN4706_c0_g1_i1.p1  ORF type:complete len:237 (+),score=35.43 TRINITY_DN4706_c0_g1_i1:58-711(+)